MLKNGGKAEITMIWQHLFQDVSHSRETRLGNEEDSKTGLVDILECIWNMDETDIVLGVCTNQTVVGSSSTTISYKKSLETQWWDSIIEAISTSSQRVPPLSPSRESPFKAAGSSRGQRKSSLHVDQADSDHRDHWSLSLPAQSALSVPFPWSFGLRWPIGWHWVMVCR